MNRLIYEKTEQLCRQNDRAVVAIDGMCASGKTTLAGELAECFGGVVIHADSFFLLPEMRTPERLSEPGGNFHRERFKSEVVDKLHGGSFEYGVFECSKGEITHSEFVPAKGLIVIEGAYCMHPLLKAEYDYRIFSAASPEAQLIRIEQRNGKTALESFKTKWIVFENRYFERFKIRQVCDAVVLT